MTSNEQISESPDNLVDLFENSLKKYSGNSFIGTKGEDGEYSWVTYAQVGKRVDDCRAGLSKLGVGKGDTVGIIGSNSLQWVIGAYATYGLGARWVPMYEAELESVWKYVVSDADIKVLLVADESVYDKVKNYKTKIITTYGDGENSLCSMETQGRENPVDAFHPTAKEICGLIYTSGTTGDPKGVLLSHGNITSNAAGGYHMVSGLDENCRALSILPWAHSYAQTAELHNFMQFGGSIGLAENVKTVADDMLKVRPTHLIAVPRVFNKIYNGIWAKMEQQGGLAKKLFVMGIENAAKKRELAKNGETSFGVNLKVNIAEKIVFKKIRAKFGGCLKAALTASATMNEQIALFFYDIGIPVYDCYGLTETSPAVTMNSPDSFKFGTVGKTIENVKILVDESKGDGTNGEGEIVVYGPNVMLGYHNKPQATDEVMTPDGGFRTGDLGRIDEDGFLQITGRIKEQYKLANGKYVYPAAIEETIKLLPQIANAMIFGDGKEFNICILVPDFEGLAPWIKKNNLPGDPAKLMESEQLGQHLQKTVFDFLEGKYGRYEIPKKFVFLADDFSVDNGMLTQTMKLKRRVVIERYKSQIESLYKN